MPEIPQTLTTESKALDLLNRLDRLQAVTKLRDQACLTWAQNPTDDNRESFDEAALRVNVVRESISSVTDLDVRLIATRLLNQRKDQAKKRYENEKYEISEATQVLWETSPEASQLTE